MKWIFQGGGAQDVLDDANLYNAIHSFLNNSVQHTAPSSSAFDNSTFNKHGVLMNGVEYHSPRLSSVKRCGRLVGTICLEVAYQQH